MGLETRWNLLTQVDQIVQLRRAYGLNLPEEIQRTARNQSEIMTDFVMKIIFANLLMFD